jgi:hypothetical protein
MGKDQSFTDYDRGEIFRHPVRNSGAVGYVLNHTAGLGIVIPGSSLTPETLDQDRCHTVIQEDHICYENKE